MAAEPTEGALTYRAAAEPGITALFAAAEARWAYQALALAWCPNAVRETLIALGEITRQDHTAWVIRQRIDAGTKSALVWITHALINLTERGLVEYDGDTDAYRLTPFGQTVAAALGGEGA